MLGCIVGLAGSVGFVERVVVLVLGMDTPAHACMYICSEHLDWFVSFGLSHRASDFGYPRDTFRR